MAAGFQENKIEGVQYYIKIGKNCCPFDTMFATFDSEKLIGIFNDPEVYNRNPLNLLIERTNGFQVDEDSHSQLYLNFLQGLHLRHEDEDVQKVLEVIHDVALEQGLFEDFPHVRAMLFGTTMMLNESLDTDSTVIPYSFYFPLPEGDAHHSEWRDLLGWSAAEFNGQQLPAIRLPICAAALFIRRDDYVEMLFSIAKANDIPTHQILDQTCLKLALVVSVSQDTLLKCVNTMEPTPTAIDELWEYAVKHIQDPSILQLLMQRMNIRKTLSDWIPNSWALMNGEGQISADVERRITSLFSVTEEGEILLDSSYLFPLLLSPSSSSRFEAVLDCREKTSLAYFFICINVAFSNSPKARQAYESAKEHHPDATNRLMNYLIQGDTKVPQSIFKKGFSLLQVILLKEPERFETVLEDSRYTNHLTERAWMNVMCLATQVQEIVDEVLIRYCQPVSEWTSASGYIELAIAHRGYHFVTETYLPALPVAERVTLELKKLYALEPQQSYPDEYIQFRQSCIALGLALGESSETVNIPDEWFTFEKALGRVQQTKDYTWDDLQLIFSEPYRQLAQDNLKLRISTCRSLSQQALLCLLCANAEAFENIVNSELKNAHLHDRQHFFRRESTWTYADLLLKKYPMLKPMEASLEKCKMKIDCNVLYLDPDRFTPEKEAPHYVPFIINYFFEQLPQDEGHHSLTPFTVCLPNNKFALIQALHIFGHQILLTHLRNLYYYFYQELVKIEHETSTPPYSKLTLDILFGQEIPDIENVSGKEQLTLRRKLDKGEQPVSPLGLAIYTMNRSVIDQLCQQPRLLAAMSQPMWIDCFKFILASKLGPFLSDYSRKLLKAYSDYGMKESPTISKFESKLVRRKLALGEALSETEIALVREKILGENGSLPCVKKDDVQQLLCNIDKQTKPFEFAYLHMQLVQYALWSQTDTYEMGLNSLKQADEAEPELCEAMLLNVLSRIEPKPWVCLYLSHKVNERLIEFYSGEERGFSQWCLGEFCYYQAQESKPKETLIPKLYTFFELQSTLKEVKFPTLNDCVEGAVPKRSTSEMSSPSSFSWFDSPSSPTTTQVTAYTEYPDQTLANNIQETTRRISEIISAEGNLQELLVEKRVLANQYLKVTLQNSEETDMLHLLESAMHHSAVFALAHRSTLVATTTTSSATNTATPTKKA